MHYFIGFMWSYRRFRTFKILKAGNPFEFSPKD